MDHFLGIDFGTKHIGIAIGQKLTLTATPLTTLTVHTKTFWEQFESLITTWQPKGLVVGLAHHVDGSCSLMSEQALQFGRHLTKRFQLPVYYIEEHLTSVEAQQILKQNNLSSKKYDKDALAAAIILESWLFSVTKEQHQDAIEFST